MLCRRRLPVTAYDRFNQSRDGLHFGPGRYEPPSVFVDGDKLAANESSMSPDFEHRQEGTRCSRCGICKESHIRSGICICRFCNNDADNGHTERECPWLYGTRSFWKKRLRFDRRDSEPYYRYVPKGCQVQPNPGEQAQLKTRGIDMFRNFPTPNSGQQQVPEGCREHIPRWARNTSFGREPYTQEQDQQLQRADSPEDTSSGGIGEHLIEDSLDAEATSGDLFHRLCAAEAERDAQRAKCAQKDVEIQNLQRLERELEWDNDQLQRDYENLRHDKWHLEDHHRELQHSNLRLSDNHRELQHNNSRLSANLRNLEHNFDNLKFENQDLRCRIRTLEDALPRAPPVGYQPGRMYQHGSNQRDLEQPSRVVYGSPRPDLMDQYHERRYIRDY